jgi:glycosyltransferase involved in cell wall biosynthesis/GR25 family glycosyltransferase involved in LPS biosynthesis
MTTIKIVNQLARSGNWEKAASEYLLLITQRPELKSLIEGNLKYVLRKLPYESLSRFITEMDRLGMSLELQFTAQQIAQAAIGDFAASSLSLSDALSIHLEIEKIYVVNLDRRPDRYARMVREMSANGLSFERVSACDVATSLEAQAMWRNFRNRPIEDNGTHLKHISKDVMLRYKSQLPAAVFAYMVSQRKVLENAKAAGYRRILVLDDDVFFHSDAAKLISAQTAVLPQQLKVLLLGASEYADRASEEFKAARIFENSMCYKPIPGETCGSFAVVYDQSIYDEIIEAINQADGTYDNTILGSIYGRYPDACVAFDPAVAIPDVGDSDIRSNPRTQKVHSIKMNWQFERYQAFTKTMRVTILVQDFMALRHIQSLKPRIGYAVSVNIFYLSVDGIRPVTIGHVFSPHDSEGISFDIVSPEVLCARAKDLKVPYSDFIFLWPHAREVTPDSLTAAMFAAIQIKHAQGVSSGIIDGIYYCLKEGCKPVKGRHSIIIPAFRGPTLALSALHSALAQDVDDFEVILVNDNPDHIEFEQSICKLLLQPSAEQKAINEKSLERLIVICHKQNRNAAAARNTGVLASSGEFISFLDDDDYYERDRLSGVEESLMHLDEGFAAAYCGYIGAWNGNKDLSRFIEGDLGEQVITLQYASHYMCTNTVSFKRDSFLQIGGFNEAYWRHQDLELMVRYFTEFKIAAVQKFLVKNRPFAAPETYKADIVNLCQLKHQFLFDMSNIIAIKYRSTFETIIDAHVRDIAKRDRSMSVASVGLIKAFLSATQNISGYGINKV